MLARAASSLASRNSAHANSGGPPPWPQRKALPASPSRIALYYPAAKKLRSPPQPGRQPSPASARITVSVIVRRKQPLKAANRLGKERLTRAQYRQAHAADPDAIKLVRAFAKEYGLTPEAGTPKPEHRTVKLTGTVAAMQKAFGVELNQKTIEGVDLSRPRRRHPPPEELVRPRDGRARPR